MSPPRRLLPDPMFHTLVVLVGLVVLGIVATIVLTIRAIAVGDFAAFAGAGTAALMTWALRAATDRYTAACERYLAGDGAPTD